MDHSLLSPLKSQQALDGLKTGDILRYLRTRLFVEHCRKEGIMYFRHLARWYVSWKLLSSKS